MRLQSKLLAVIIAAFLVLYFMVEYHQHRGSRLAIAAQLQEEADLLSGIILAVSRAYHHKISVSGLPLSEHTMDFLPAHAIAQISTEFHELVDSNLSFNIVSDRPRNKKNMADTMEQEAIEYFRREPNSDFRMISYTTTDGKNHYHYTRPLRIDASCLQCHGNKEEVIKTTFADNNQAHTYTLGDVSGVISIKLPTEELEQRIASFRGSEVSHRLLVFTLTFLILYLLLQKLVIQRLGRLKQQIQRLRDGDYTARTTVDSRDELGEVALAFNTMAEAVANSEGRLRTLSQAVMQSPSSIIITDSIGTIEYVNPKFEQVTGYSLHEVCGKNPNLLKSNHTSQADYQRLWETVLRGDIWRGEFLNRTKIGTLFWEYATITPIRNEEGEIEHILAIKEDITVRKEYEQRLLHQENHDALTDLPNRILGADRLSQAVLRARRDGLHVAVISLDLDHFKIINDSLGHHSGDNILLQVAHRLRAILPEDATLARIGGDEFLIILPDLSSVDLVNLSLNSLRQLFSKPFKAEGKDIYLQPSMGVSVTPDDGEDTYVLLRNADAAMHRAKDLGRNQTQFFTPEMNERALKRLEIQSQMRHALERGELLLHYQPQVDALSGELAGAEALVRWLHPAMGLVGPDQFIPLAEENGLIIPIGCWVLETACREAMTWPEHLRLSVNISARQFRDRELVTKIEAVLAKTGFAADRLELEVTENLLLEDLTGTTEILLKLRDLGVHIALDDFGTGYSSLSYLKRFPFGILKIDRSFINDILIDPEDASLCEAIIQLGHVLNLRVIAEGVETAEQLEFLIACGVDLVQGYYYSRPLPAEEFRAYLQQKPG